MYLKYLAHFNTLTSSQKSQMLRLGFGEKALHETVSAVSALPTWSLASQLPERQMNGSDGLAACVFGLAIAPGS
jgi:hypothetical protein